MSTPFRTLGLLSLLACNPPLRGGNYQFTVVEVLEDSCGFDEVWDYQWTDDGSVWWEDDQTLVVMTDFVGEWHWQYDGRQLSSDLTLSEAIDDSCQLVLYDDYLGEITSANSLAFTETADVQLEGSCIAYNADGTFPCSLVVGWEGDRIGDSLE